MLTYQDLVAVGESDQERMDFVLRAINEHRGTFSYKTAEDADLYYKHLNPTIMRAQKFIYDVMGRAHMDEWSPNHKIPSRYYFYFVTQEVLFLLGNGVGFSASGTKKKLGETFDKTVVDLVIDGMNAGVSFGFWNLDHLENFSLLEFAPLYDEETSYLRAGIRFWQIDENKPLRCTLYEEDGYTEYIRRKGEEMRILVDKRPYVRVIRSSPATGIQEIADGENYPSFPIVPFYNINRQSELIGTRDVIDAYDLMASTLVNNVDNGNLIYWVIKNAGGMDDMDDQRFVERLKTLHVFHTEGEEEVDAHQVQAPFEANENALERLRNQICDDFMGLDVRNISSGAVTATQIQAAYEPLNSKCDLLEGQVTEFIQRVLDLVGVQDQPTYTRSMIVNQQEMIQNMVTASTYLPEDYVTRKILEVLGDIDDADKIIKEMTAESVNRMARGNMDQEEPEEEEEQEQ